MCRSKRIMIYGDAAECQEAMGFLREIPVFSGCQLHSVDSWSALQEELEPASAALLIVLADGAAGMEGVYLARHTRPEVPVFWFSNDCGFSMQSHRLECEYFATKPLTNDKLRKALCHCEKLGVQL